MHHCSGLLAEIDSMLGKIGQTVATLHDGGLIHGDLTTSNMLIQKSDSAVVGDNLHTLESLLTSLHTVATKAASLLDAGFDRFWIEL